MWLRRLVGVVMILTCIGMNALVLVGFFSPVKVSKVGFLTDTPAPTVPAPTVTITAKPDAISAGSFSALTWSTTNSPDTCAASDAWSGAKTPFGAESTGRISTPGNYSYTLTCTNKGGVAKASVTIAVGPAAAPPPAAPKGNTNGSGTSAPATTYCNGASPCYGPREVATHSGGGNCWGWLGTRVLNVSGFDVGFHAARSAVSSIQIGGICGKDLLPAISGQVSSSDYPSGHDHQLGAKNSSDTNYLGYYVGYFDSSKP
jgi:hypothetical protein